MRLITCHGGRLHALFSEGLGERRGKFFSTGLAVIDALLPWGGFGRGAVHEILGEPGGASPLFFAMLLARAAAESRRAIVWCDPGRLIYAPRAGGGGD